MSDALAERVAARLRGAVPDPAQEAAEIAAAARAGRGAAAEAEALSLAARRAAGEPLAYLLGRARFMGVTLQAGPGALAPREETELLGRTAVEWLAARSPAGAGLLLLDLCCGSGNLACGIAAALPALRAVACDLTEGAVALARRNVAALGLASRVEVRQGDLFGALGDPAPDGAFDLIACNPPYISSARLAKDRAALLAHEPREAFDGGPYGLSVHQRVVREAARWLRAGGALAFEIGLGQERQVRLLLERAGRWEPASGRCDPAGHPRVLLARGKR